MGYLWLRANMASNPCFIYKSATAYELNYSNNENMPIHCCFYLDYVELTLGFALINLLLQIICW